MADITDERKKELETLAEATAETKLFCAAGRDNNEVNLTAFILNLHQRDIKEPKNLTEQVFFLEQIVDIMEKRYQEDVCDLAKKQNTGRKKCYPEEIFIENLKKEYWRLENNNAFSSNNQCIRNVINGYKKQYPDWDINEKSLTRIMQKIMKEHKSLW